MTTHNGPAHVVVDGSNIATEGRSMPSLKQLNEAVMSFMEEHPHTEITVVVDATFGHRIDKKETKEFEAGISNNELVAPPAGAVGRGDAFVLGIANKAGSTVLSNDSFQEFHGEYEWLFDEGRLVGGKPVPHVGWVWVARTPVRGPISRKATRGTGSGTGRSRGGGRSGSRSRGRQDDGQARVGSAEASAPMPVPKSPPPNSGSARSSKSDTSQKSVPSRGEPVNDLLPFLEFVEHHPVGTSVNGTVDSYSSHGAYITVTGDSDGSEVRGYIPLRMMADPTPRSAKSIMKVGESVIVVVVSFNGARRSIDCALPDMADAAITAAASEIDDDDVVQVDAAEPPKVKKSAPKKQAARKTAVKKQAAKKTPTKKAAAKKTPTKKQAAKKTPTKKAAAKKTPTKKQAAATKAAPGRSAAKKSPVKKKAAAGKTTAKPKAVAKQTPVMEAAVDTPGGETSTVRKIPVAKTPIKKHAAKKAAASRTASKTAPAKRTSARKRVAKKAAVPSPTSPAGA